MAEFCAGSFLSTDTTRAPRAGETDGKEYHFVTRDAFENLIDSVSWCSSFFLSSTRSQSQLMYETMTSSFLGGVQKAFIEHAQFSGNYYGTSSQAVKDVSEKGVRCILDIDSQGVKLVKANHPSLNCIFVFLAPPSLADLQQRLQGRGTETEEAVSKRLEASKAEIAYAKEGVYDVVIVNDDMDKAYQKLKAVTVEERLDQGDAIPETL